MQRQSADIPNVVCGAIFMLFGAFFAYQSTQMDIGTAVKMGPGYFPLLVAAVLIILGAIIVFQAFRVAHEPVGHIAWRGLAFILPTPIFFGLTVQGLGFIPAIFITALIASFASERMRPLRAVLIAAGVTAFSTLVFVKGLGLPFRMFGPWLGQ
jgi:hypothetical protein